MKNTRLVFSTDGARLEEDARRTQVSKASKIESTLGDGTIRIFRERTGRGGKVVTVIRGLPDRGAALDARAAELRRLCGAGGTVKDGAVEVQGDHRERVAERLCALGYKVKLAGG